jgi:hypothetical protein
MSHSAVNELLLAVRRADEPSNVEDLPSGEALQPAHQWRWKKWRRCVLKFAATASFFAVLIASCWFSFALALKRRLGRAHISLKQAEVEINSNALEMRRLQFFLSLPQSLASMPVVSYELSIEHVAVHVGLGSGSGSSSYLGVATLPRQLRMQSWHGLDSLVDANVEIAQPQRTGVALAEFLTEPNLTMWSQATCRIRGTIWGWLPFYFPSMTVQRTMLVPGMSLNARPMRFQRMSAMQGTPGALSFVGEAFVVNPTPVTLIVRDSFQTRVFYNNTEVGTLNMNGTELPAIRLSPGSNVLSGGGLMIHESAANKAAISSLMTAYIANSCREEDLEVRIRGPVKSRSGQIRKLFEFDGLRMPAIFRPAASDIMPRMAADFVVGGYITHWPPASLKVMLHPTFHNPLPVQVRLEHISLDASYTNASTNVPLFSFSQSLVANQHVIPPLGTTTFRLLLWASDTLAPGAMGLVANGSAKQRQIMHVSTKFLVIISPAHRRELHFKSDRVPTTICFSRATPAVSCTE